MKIMQGLWFGASYIRDFTVVKNDLSNSGKKAFRQLLKGVKIWKMKEHQHNGNDNIFVSGMGKLLIMFKFLTDIWKTVAHFGDGESPYDNEWFFSSN